MKFKTQEEAQSAGASGAESHRPDTSSSAGDAAGLEAGAAAQAQPAEGAADGAEEEDGSDEDE